MEWREVRSAFIRARRGRNQQAIAKAAGLGQGDISKLESNDKLGPTVGTFIKAVEKGLQIPLSAFFLQIEQKNHAVTEIAAPDRDTTAPSITEAIEHGSAVSPSAVAADVLTVIERFERAVIERERQRPAGAVRPIRQKSRPSKSVRRKSRA